MAEKKERIPTIEDLMMPFDGNYQSTLISPVCSLCQHWSPQAENAYACKAFDKIPLDIWQGKVSHLSAYKGDRGIRFQAKA